MRIQHYVNRMAKAVADENDELTVALEFITLQLLHMAKSLDFSDEVGRRNMSKLISRGRSQVSTSSLLLFILVVHMQTK